MMDMSAQPCTVPSMPDDDMTSINLTLRRDLLNAIDQARGDVPRVRFIRRAIETRLGHGDSEPATAIINGNVVAAPVGAIAYKYNGPTESARWIYDETDLRDIRREDPGLVVAVTID